MRSVKKLGLLVSALAFCLGIFVVTGNAQYGGNRRWQNNNDGSVREYRNRERRWRSQSYNGYGRISPQEARRLQRQRYRIYNQRERAYRDGYVSDRERWNLQRKYNKYRRNVYRDRRDW